MKKLLPLLVPLALAGAPAYAAVLDFEGLANGSVVDSFSFVDNGVTVTGTVSATGGANEARVFDTNLTGTADPDLEGPFSGGAMLSPGNVLIIQEEAGVASAIPDDNADGGVITLTFSSLVTFTGLSVLDDARVTISSNANSRERTVEVDNDNFGRNFAFSSRVFGDFTELTFDFNGESGAIDNLQFSALAAVPVPAALPLMLVGMGAFGIASRRRKNAAA